MTAIFTRQAVTRISSNHASEVLGAHNFRIGPARDVAKPHGTEGSEKGLG